MWVDMRKQKERPKRVHIRAYDDEPGVFLVVVTDNPEPGAVPVIPTAKALSYWRHPSHGGSSAAL